MIDDPIKKVVVGLSLLGFKTQFSCCGFHYAGEGTKFHMPVPQVLLEPNICEELLQLLKALVDESGWEFWFTKSSIVFVGQGWESGHPWAVADCPYQCEAPLLSIAALERALTGRRPTFKQAIVIECGNKQWRQGKLTAAYPGSTVGKYWQDQPCEPWWVTPKTFDEL